MLAQVSANPDWVSPIIQFGIGGGVLVWFMFRSEPRMKKIEEAIDRLARAVLINAITYGNDVQKEQANLIIKEIDKAEDERKS